MGTTEMLIRNSTTPPLDYNDVSSAEIDAKIRLVTTYVRRTYFEGGSVPSDATDAIVLLILSNILSRSDLARKYGTLSSETLGDYSYEIAGVMSRGSQMQSNPLTIIKGWHDMALEILESLSSGNKYQIRKANE